MQAIIFDSFGDPDVLREATVATPEPGPGQVRVRVRTASVNAFDGKVRSGAMEALFATPLPATSGLEVAGTVDALGPGVAGVSVGDAVLGWSDTGGYAEYALVSGYAPKPAGLSWEHAATLPVASDAARRGLDRLDLRPGETLLINGAAGSVGTLAVQLAVADGVRVIGTAGAGNQRYLADLGAEPTTYGDGLVGRVRALAPDGVDAVFDIAGRGALPAAIELRGGTSRIVTIADPAAGELGIPFESGPERRSAAELTDLAVRAAEGRLVATVAGTYPLAAAAEAQRANDAGHARGKIVLTVA